MGPTASGKSAVALELAEKLGAEIVNADSRQIYRGFDAGTSKPSPRDRERAPHHLYDFLDPKAHFSAGDYVRAASGTLDAILGRGKPAILAGGTGLYVKSLFEGLSDLPGRNESLRISLAAYAEAHGRKALHERLKSVDAASAKKIPFQNIQRVLRALEVYETTGKPLSQHHEAPRKSSSVPPAIFFGILWERSRLKERILLRSGEIARPMIEETRRHLAAGIPEEAPAFQSLGYRSALSVVRGEIGFEVFLEDLSRKTLQYAKRQMTWFRKDPKIRWLPAREPFDPKALADEIRAHLV